MFLKFKKVLLKFRKARVTLGEDKTTRTNSNNDSIKNIIIINNNIKNNKNNVKRNNFNSNLKKIRPPANKNSKV